MAVAWAVRMLLNYENASRGEFGRMVSSVWDKLILRPMGIFTVQIQECQGRELRREATAM